MVGWKITIRIGRPIQPIVQHKRYRFGNQPEIALWNLYQLANALYPLINDAKPLEAILDAFIPIIKRSI